MTRVVTRSRQLPSRGRCDSPDALTPTAETSLIYLVQLLSAAGLVKSESLVKAAGMVMAGEVHHAGCIGRSTGIQGLRGDAHAAARDA